MADNQDKGRENLGPPVETITTRKASLVAHGFVKSKALMPVNKDE
jgi:hypothetical protein